MNYKKSKWKRIRAAVLMRDGYMCQECKRYGKTTEATEVHHILPADECTGVFEPLIYKSKNLVSLCGACHKEMHVNWNKMLSEKGEKLLKRSGVFADTGNIPPNF